MSFQCGFFNSVNGDRKYNAEQISKIFDGLMTNGIVAHYGEKFAVTPGNGMNVLVGSGRCWINHVWGLSDGNNIVSIDPSDVSQKRIDAIVIEVDRRDEIRNAFIKAVKGTLASGTPTKPTLIQTESITQWPLAYVTVNANVTSISASNIQVVIGTSESPYITGILESINIDNLLDQWEGEFDEWFQHIQNQMSGNVVTNLQNQIDSLNNNKANKIDVNSAIENVADGVYINGVKYIPNIINNINKWVCKNVSEKFGVVNKDIKTPYVFEKNDFAYMYTVFSNGLEFFRFKNGEDPIYIYLNGISNINTSFYGIYPSHIDNMICFYLIRVGNYYNLYRVNFRTKNVTRVNAFSDYIRFICDTSDKVIYAYTAGSSYSFYIESINIESKTVTNMYSGGNSKEFADYLGSNKFLFKERNGWTYYLGTVIDSSILVENFLSEGQMIIRYKGSDSLWYTINSQLYKYTYSNKNIKTISTGEYVCNGYFGTFPDGKKAFYAYKSGDTSSDYMLIFDNDVIVYAGAFNIKSSYLSTGDVFERQIQYNKSIFIRSNYEKGSLIKISESFEILKFMLLPSSTIIPYDLYYYLGYEVPVNNILTIDYLSGDNDYFLAGGKIYLNTLDNQIQIFGLWTTD